MKTAKKATEHYLLPLNLAFLSFFGIFLVYALDRWSMDAPEQTQPVQILLPSLFAFLLLTASLKYRKPYFQVFCSLFALIALAFLF
ncbi:hypothetical protein J0A68_10230 [Algoriphagus sp. H41]|uniref:Uncharacterized protein n=1 Tax=Algoriphagus oliviformis TaxID=2811231 RepID=A0ABS3C311_9BACT|nr:hypothetical protein [Algoriphagus oliviformis]MBN7811337.1 hypothetical protein [Algoriphagus oliviformis]